jgi:hypothetical protein
MFSIKTMMQWADTFDNYESRIKKKTKFMLYLVVLALLILCNRNSLLQQSLALAGDNRAELESCWRITVKTPSTV